MSLVTVFLVLVIAGVVLWLVNTYIPMDAGVKKLLNIAVIVILVLWLLKAFGVLDQLTRASI